VLAAPTKMALLRSSPSLRLFLSVVGDEVEFGAGGGFEFGRAFCAREIVADAKGVAFDFVDARKGFAGVGPFSADDGHVFWFR